MAKPVRSALALLLPVLFLLPYAACAQNDPEVGQLKEQVQQLTALVNNLQSRLAALEDSRSRPVVDDAPAENAAALRTAAAELRQTGDASPSPAAQAVAPPAPSAAHLPALLAGTLNFYFDGYFENNFNNPVGRVNNLRAYDVLSRTFSINQADLIFALDPDPAARRRYGMRLDLQYGQATETLQGNPYNELRPEIYQNIFQAYGTYVVPMGSGLSVDFGKWASSLGIEGNYTKDQMNYTRSFYFNFLPFYHEGVRAHYNLNQRLAANYWVVNGTNQSEPTNGYRDELFGFTAQPAKKITWTANYYIGQEHPDASQASSCSVPVQPGLCFVPLRPAPNGKIHIIDSYVTWNAAPRLTLAAEADYLIQREWAHAAPGESAAPSHDDGGAGYAQYQFSPRSSVAARVEYLSDRGGLFSGTTQALKETTGTWRYNLADGLAAFFEYRRDWSNRPYFITHDPAAPSAHQDTAGIGLVWWYGAKQGNW